MTAADEQPVPMTPIRSYLAALHARLAGDDRGTVADYIPELARADPSWFGIAIATVDGAVYETGDTRVGFTIQSISKPLTFAMALEAHGESVRERIGVEPTGEAFNAIELDPLNPMVNAGAILARGLLGAEADPAPLDAYGRFAGRQLEIDERVRRSEAQTSHRNRAIGQLLRGAGRLDGDPDAVVESYIEQCSIVVDCRDLAVIAATLAAGGRNPITRVRVASPETVRDVLSVMATSGMYDAAGDWLYDVGLPAKSGVAGGLIAVLPGRFGIGVFSPRLDERGNTVRGVRVCEELSRSLDLHMFNHDHGRPSPVRRTFTLAEMTSRRVRDPAVAAAILRDGERVRAFELQGDIGFAEAEQIERAVVEAQAELVVLDLRRVSDIHRAATGLLAGLGDHISALSAAPQALCDAVSVPAFDELDRALEWCEDRLTGDTEAPSLRGVRDHPVLRDVGDEDLARLEGVLVHRTFAPGERLLRAGEPVTELFLLTKGIASETLDGADGRTRRVTTVTAGMTVGEMALVGDTGRIGDVRADTEVEAYSLAADALAGLGDLDPELRARLLRNLLAVIAARVQSTRAGLTSLID